MNEATLQKMKNMKFYGMMRAFSTTLESGQTSRYTPDEMVGFLVESEWDERHNRKIDRGLKNAKFRYKANIEDLIFDQKRNLDKNEVHRLADCTFIGKKQNIIITGSTGVGKSYLASALGYQACINGYKIIYSNTSKLISKLKMAKADGSYIREMLRIEKQDLLILDDFGLQPFDAQGRASLMEIVEDRHGKSSLMITSQVPVKQWFDLIGEKTIADAILDRIVHDSIRIELKGESLRKRKTETVEMNDEN
ncbi:MAG: IS21-like element helper ATPase IstB, partial [Bacteroidia bacterium]|nr:IS21-like element helper ATPase IstB [Bacteroidia bacterium]HQW94687.1 IS21-like element helper ATPase IstB [Saprospiraceae bacterium]